MISHLFSTENFGILLFLFSFFEFHFLVLFSSFIILYFPLNSFTFFVESVVLALKHVFWMIGLCRYNRGYLKTCLLNLLIEFSNYLIHLFLSIFYSWETFRLFVFSLLVLSQYLFSNSK